MDIFEKYKKILEYIDDDQNEDSEKGEIYDANAATKMFEYVSEPKNKQKRRSPPAKKARRYSSDEISSSADSLIMDLSSSDSEDSGSDTVYN